MYDVRRRTTCGGAPRGGHKAGRRAATRAASWRGPRAAPRPHPARRPTRPNASWLGRVRGTLGARRCAPLGHWVDRAVGEAVDRSSGRPQATGELPASMAKPSASSPAPASSPASHEPAADEARQRIPGKPRAGSPKSSPTSCRRARRRAEPSASRRRLVSGAGGRRGRSMGYRDSPWDRGNPSDAWDEPAHAMGAAQRVGGGDMGTGRRMRSLWGGAAHAMRAAQSVGAIHRSG